MMTKPAWLTEIEIGLSQLEQEEAKRTAIAPADPVASGIGYAVAEIRARLVRLTDPSAERTPAQFAAEQSPPVTEQAVRIWIKKGELPARATAKGWRIPAGAQRTRKPRAAAAA